MAERNTTNGLNFEALHLAIERCDPDQVLDFYAEDAELSIVNAQAQQGSHFELWGKAEIAKHLRATFAPETSHRVEREDIVGEDRVTFQEACEYPDGSRIVVETTLEVRDGKIFHQVDVVRGASRAGSKKEIGRSPPTRRGYPRTRPEENVPLSDRLPRFEQTTEEEEIR
jgi:predicted RNA-binding Zn ribbon-like protein